MVGTPTYRTWTAMKSRCNGNTDDYHKKSYHLRGITYCDRWEFFINFLNDMGKRPEGKTLDRIDNDKGYSKKNCRWATPKEQRANQRNYKKPINNVTGFKGVGWCKKTNSYRVYLNGKHLGMTKFLEEAVKIRKKAESTK